MVRRRKYELSYLDSKSATNTTWLSMVNGLKRLDTSELKLWVTRYRDNKPDAPSVWLRDFVLRINYQLQGIPDQDPCFHGYAVNYPLYQLRADVRLVIEDAIKMADLDVLERLFEHCVQAMVQHLEHGESSYGYRLFIQILAYLHPDIALNNLSKYLELMKVNQLHPNLCLSIMWAVGQCGVNDLSCGLRVWLAVMVPALGLQYLSDYAVTYLTQLFEIHSDVRTAYSSITFRDYFPILDIIMSGSSSLSTTNQRKLLLLYPKMKEIAFGEQKEGMLKNFFPSFLARIKPSASNSFTQELFSCLVTCLERDVKCFNVWEKMHVTHMIQSSAFVNYLARTWESVCIRVDVNRLEVTLSKFLACKTREIVGYQKFIEACRNLKNQMAKTDVVIGPVNLREANRSSSACSVVMFALFGIIVGTIFYIVVLEEKNKAIQYSPQTSDELVDGFYNRISSVKSYISKKIHGPTPRYIDAIQLQLSNGYNTFRDYSILAYDEGVKYSHAALVIMKVWYRILMMIVNAWYDRFTTWAVIFIFETIPDNFTRLFEYMQPYFTSFYNYLCVILVFLLRKLSELCHWAAPYVEDGVSVILHCMDYVLRSIAMAWSIILSRSMIFYDYACKQWKVIVDSISGQQQHYI